MSQVGQKDTKSVGKPLLKLHDDLDDEFRLKVSTDCKLPEFFRLGFQLLFPEPRSNTQPHKKIDPDMQLPWLMHMCTISLLIYS